MWKELSEGTLDRTLSWSDSATTQEQHNASSGLHVLRYERSRERERKRERRKKRLKAYAGSAVDCLALAPLSTCLTIKIYDLTSFTTFVIIPSEWICVVYGDTHRQRYTRREYTPSWFNDETPTTTTTTTKLEIISSSSRKLLPRIRIGYSSSPNDYTCTLIVISVIGILIIEEMQ